MGATVIIGSAYLIAAVSCLVAWRSAAADSGSPDVTGPRSWPWLLMAVTLVAAAAGRRLDVDTSTADLGRELAASGGWYDIRRPIQVALILALLILWVGSVRALLLRHRRVREPYLPTAIVVGSLIALVTVRSVSLHVVDAGLTRFGTVGITTGAMLETSAALLAAVLAGKAAVEARAHRNRPAESVRSG